MLAEDQGGHLRRRRAKLLGDQAAEADRVELRAQADHLRRRQLQSRCAARYVSTSTGFETTSTTASRLHAGLLNLAENAEEQIDVAIDQIEPAFVRLAAQAGRDADHVARRDLLVAAGANHLIGHERAAVQQVERLAGGQLGVDVEQRDLADDAAGLQGKARARADQSAAADDADFHAMFESGVLKTVIVVTSPAPPSRGR